MNSSIRIITIAIMIIMGATNATAIEEAKYEVVEKDNSFEIRNYEPQVVAEIIVEGDLEEAGKIAFKRLFQYISGDNQSRAKISMTAPVSLETASEKIKMTAPVEQQRSQEKWAVSFMMPASYTLDSLPIPNDPDIKLRKISARRVVAVQYSGFWSEKSYLQHKSELEAWIDESGFIVTGEAIWARYNSPFTPWFLRRNEVLIPVETATNNVNFK